VVARALACTRVAERRDPAAALRRAQDADALGGSVSDSEDEFGLEEDTAAAAAALYRRLQGATLLEVDEHMVVFRTTAEQVVVVFRSVSQVGLGCKLG
jgi:hypothetical protein